MFTDFTTAETLAHHRAAELERRIEMEHRRADHLVSVRPFTDVAEEPAHGFGHVLETLHLVRPHHRATAA
jgi:hypothetical protein